MGSGDKAMVAKQVYSCPNAWLSRTARDRLLEVWVEQLQSESDQKCNLWHNLSDPSKLLFGKALLPLPGRDGHPVASNQAGTSSQNILHVEPRFLPEVSTLTP